MGQLSGKAVSVCAGLPSTSSNYRIIWDALFEKYQNTRLLVNSFSFSQQFKQNFESLQCIVQGIRKLEFREVLLFCFLYLLLSKLGNETETLFVNNYRQSTVPAYNEVLEFIKEQT